MSQVNPPPTPRRWRMVFHWPVEGHTTLEYWWNQNNFTISLQVLSECYTSAALVVFTYSFQVLLAHHKVFLLQISNYSKVANLKQSKVGIVHLLSSLASLSAWMWEVLVLHSIVGEPSNQGGDLSYVGEGGEPSNQGGDLSSDRRPGGPFLRIGGPRGPPVQD